MSISFETVQCKICGSHHTVKNGKAKGVQSWKCKKCGVKFLDNHAYYGMKTPAVQVRTAIQMYYQGMSLPTICRQLKLNFNNHASISTVYAWVNKYSSTAFTAAMDYYPQVGDVWFVTQTSFNLLGGEFCIADIIDTRTHFLLATQISINGNSCNIRSLMEQAFTKAKKTPKLVVSDNLMNQLKGIQCSFKIEAANNEMEPFRNIFQMRASLMVDLKRKEKVRDFVNGWLIYYNYYRHNEYLWGKTPSQLANVRHVHKNRRRLRIN